MANTQIDKGLKTPDYNSPRESGDFYLLECSIHSPSGGSSAVQLNVPGVLIQLNVYEDLFSNILKGQLTFVDTQGLAEAIPLIGEETLILSFLTPGGQGTQTTVESSDVDSRTVAEEAVKQRFKIYDCKETQIQNRVRSYQLFFVSEEYVTSSKIKVSKGYSGRKYSSIVKDVMNKINKNIKSDYQKNIYIEETSTPQNVIVPNWSPFQAINFCASRSLSDDATPQDQTTAAANPSPRALGSLFVFYEKLGTGFFYESIETMIGKQKSQDNIPLYQYTPKIAGNREESLGISYFGVDQFEVESSFKTLENLQQGLFGSTLIAYDPLRMKYNKIKYDYHKSTVKGKEEKDDLTGVTQISTEADNQNDDTDRRFHDFISTDISAQDFKQNKLVSTNSDFVGSNETVIKLATTTRDHEYFAAPGGVGGPPNNAPNLMAVPFGHQLYSGYYIVSKIRHIITSGEYQTDIELIKNSFAQRLPGQVTDLSTDGTGG